jgi:hypothetical protein
VGDGRVGEIVFLESPQPVMYDAGVVSNRYLFLYHIYSRMSMTSLTRISRRAEDHLIGVIAGAIPYLFGKE